MCWQRRGLGGPVLLGWDIRENEPKRTQRKCVKNHRRQPKTRFARENRTIVGYETNPLRETPAAWASASTDPALAEEAARRGLAGRERDAVVADRRRCAGPAGLLGDADLVRAG